MANITIVKLKVRRGSDTQRKEIVLDQGEIGYTLDSKRLFVGDGSTYGGKVAGILLESSGMGHSVDRLSIGVGVNLGSAPKNVKKRTSHQLGSVTLLENLSGPKNFWRI